MGISDFDAGPPDSMSEPDPVDATFPEEADTQSPEDREAEAIAHSLDSLSSEFAALAPAGDAVDPVLWPRCLDRVQAELELFDLLVEHRVQGPVWETVVEALSAYASQVLALWITNDKIYAQAVARRILGIPAWPEGRRRLARDRNYREEVIAHIVVRALEKLRNGLIAGQGWNPRTRH